MANVNCEACEELRQTDPNLIVNGFSNTECASLKNDTGLVASSGHDDCEDLNDLNDCLVGNLETEVEKYEVCDWRDFTKMFINNLWTTLKAMICAICGLWTNLHCLRKSLVKLVNYLANTTSSNAFVRYYRDLGTGADVVPYWENVAAGFSATLDIYMDSDGISGGSKPADRDYAVIISNCTNLSMFRDFKVRVTYYSSGDERDVSVIRTHQAQHPGMVQLGTGTTYTTFSWTTSGSVLLKKGEHIKVNAYVESADKGESASNKAPRFRLHQFVLTWIPVNVDDALDPSDILDC